MVFKTIASTILQDNLWERRKDIFLHMENVARKMF